MQKNNIINTVLVTCVGSGVGQSVLDSLNLNRRYRILGCDGNRNIYANSYCDKFFIVPNIYSENYLLTILDICKKNSVDIVIPGHDHELSLFSKNRELFENEGIKVLVSFNPEIIEVSRHKLKWYEYFTAFGCNIVPTYLVKEYRSNPNEKLLPAIIKPIGGSASQGILIINSLSELVSANEDDIIQPYLFPEKSDANYNQIYDAVKKGQFVQRSEISIQLLFNSDSRFSGIFISKNTLKNGVPVFVDPIDPKEFAYTDEIMKFVPVLESKKTTGPVNIQGRVTPKGLYFFEMNMRFTGITGNRALLGFNEVEYLVDNFLGYRNDTLSNYAHNKLGARQVACTTIPREYKTIHEPILIILGAGSEVGRTFLIENAQKYKMVYLIAREESYERYTNLFSQPYISIIRESDMRATECLCQADILINFASALAYESDQKKYDALRFMLKWTTRAAKAKIPLIINLSSQSVYPQNVNIKKNEQHIIEYENSYAFQKVLMEDMFTNIRELSPLSKVISLRLPRIINPNNLKQTGFFGKLVKENTVGMTLPYPQNNTNLIHISDVHGAINYIIDNRDIIDFPSLLNVSGENVSLEGYCHAISELKGENSLFILEENKEVLNSSMIDGTLFESLGWKRRNSIRNIIQQINDTPS